MSTDKKVDPRVGIAEVFAESKLKDKELVEYHYKVWIIAIKMINKFFKKQKHDISLSEMCESVIFYDILNYVRIEDLESKFGTKVAQLVFNITDFEDDQKVKNLYPYEKLFKSYDDLFAKLIIRNAIIHVAISDLDLNKFTFHIKQYNELRRKVMKSTPDLTFLMDYEAELIKYGRNYLSGKSANAYKYENLIL